MTSTESPAFADTTSSTDDGSTGASESPPAIDPGAEREILMLNKLALLLRTLAAKHDASESRDAPTGRTTRPDSAGEEILL